MRLLRGPECTSLCSVYPRRVKPNDLTVVTQCKTQHLIHCQPSDCFQHMPSRRGLTTSNLSLHQIFLREFNMLPVVHSASFNCVRQCFTRPVSSLMLHCMNKKSHVEPCVKMPVAYYLLVCSVRKGFPRYKYITGHAVSSCVGIFC